MYYKNYRHCEDARELYAAVPSRRQVPACTECGACEQACPNRLAIVKKLQEAHSLLA
jgi:predicted aldo/keto reductase-like oxidoreductase